MKILLTLVLGCCLSLTSFSAESPALAASHRSTTTTIVPSAKALETFAHLKIRDIEKLLGRKLSLKEKLAVKIYQWKIKKGFTPSKKVESSQKGKTAFLLGLIAIGSLIIPYLGLAALPCAILAIIFGNQARKINRNDKKANTGIILGWITIGLFVLAIIIVIAVLASIGPWTFG